MWHLLLNVKTTEPALRLALDLPQSVSRKAFLHVFDAALSPIDSGSV